MFISIQSEDEIAKTNYPNRFLEISKIMNNDVFPPIFSSVYTEINISWIDLVEVMLWSLCGRLSILFPW